MIFVFFLCSWFATHLGQIDTWDSMAERDIAVILQILDKSPRSDWKIVKSENRREVKYKLEKIKESLFFWELSYYKPWASLTQIYLHFPSTIEETKAFMSRTSEPDKKNQVSVHIPQPLLKVFGFDMFEDLRHVNIVKSGYTRDNVVPYHGGLTHLFLRLEIVYDSLGRIVQITKPFPFEPVRSYRPRREIERKQADHESLFWLIAQDTDGFRELRTEYGWVTRDGVAATQFNRYLLPVDAKGVSVPAHSCGIFLSPVVQEAMQVVLLTKSIWQDPNWKPANATQLAGKVLMRGATLVRLSDAKKFVDPGRWDQFAKLTEGQPKNKVMILDRGRKLCLIGRLDPDGEGIQVTIQGKDYHWIVKPEWFEK